MNTEDSADTATDEPAQALQRLQQLQLMLARARVELCELESEMHRQEGRVEILTARAA